MFNGSSGSGILDCQWCDHQFVSYSTLKQSTNAKWENAVNKYCLLWDALAWFFFFLFFIGDSKILLEKERAYKDYIIKAQHKRSGTRALHTSPIQQDRNP